MKPAATQMVSYGTAPGTAGGWIPLITVLLILVALAQTASTSFAATVRVGSGERYLFVKDGVAAASAGDTVMSDVVHGRPAALKIVSQR